MTDPHGTNTGAATAQLDRSGTPRGPRGREAYRVARQLADDPIPVLRDLRERWGDVSAMRVAGSTFVFLFHPDDIEQVLVGHARHVNKGRLLEQLRPLMGLQLFTFEGEEHARRRRIVSTYFRPRDLPPKVAPVVEAVGVMTGRWHEGEAFDALAELDLVTISAVSGGLFGRSIEPEAARIQGLVHELYGYLEWVTSPQFAFTRHLPLPRRRRMRRTRDELLAIVAGLLEEARERLAATPPGEAPEVGDVATRMLVAREEAAADPDHHDGALTDAQLVDELAGLLVAAHEGIALTVMFALHELCGSSEWRERAYAEVDAVLGVGAQGRAVTADDLRALPVLRAIVDETVRHYGSTMILRGIEQPLDLDTGGVRMRGGWQVIAGMYEAHRDERWWPEPAAFDPARFLDGDERQQARPRFAYFPFGGGRRTCIGSHLGLQTCVVMLAELLRDWRFERTSEAHVAVHSKVLVRPITPIRLVPFRR